MVIYLHPRIVDCLLVLFIGCLTFTRYLGCKESTSLWMHFHLVPRILEDRHGVNIETELPVWNLL